MRRNLRALKKLNFSTYPFFLHAFRSEAGVRGGQAIMPIYAYTKYTHHCPPIFFTKKYIIFRHKYTDDYGKICLKGFILSWGQNLNGERLYP